MKTIIIAIVLVAALAGGWYIWNNTQVNTPETTNEVTQDTEIQPSEDTDANNSLVDLLQSGQNQICTYTYNGEDETTVTGTTYIAGDRMRNNYELTGNNQDMTGSMIRNGDTLYVWASNMPEGLKMTFNIDEFMQDLEDSPDAESQTANPDWGPVDPNLELDYNCESWNTDDSLFNPPSDVTFRDMSAILENLPTEFDPESMNSCAICESLQGTALQACRENFNCE